MEPMRILVTLDEAYLPPLQVLLTSLHVNHPGEGMEICLLHDVEVDQTERIYNRLAELAEAHSKHEEVQA